MTEGLAPIPFSDLFSACPTEKVNAANRVDPYWFGLWIGGSQISWTSRRMAERWEKAGMGRMHGADKKMTPEMGRRLLLARNSYRPRRLASLAASGMWRTLSTEQAAAIVGSAQVAHYAHDLRAGYAAGLLERGRFAVPTIGVKNQPFVSLYRPIDSRDFHEFAEHLTYQEWIAITAGYPWRAGNQYDRHNMLATEFGLRVAEFCEIGSVVGESLSTFGLLAPKEAVPVRSEHRAADLTMVRTDGMKIAVELTANTGADFKKKVGKWVEMLGEMDADQDGLSVVFLVAHSPERPRDLHRAILSTVSDIVFGTTGAIRKRIPERIAVASWQDWFPQSHCASEAFLNLRCQRPTGPMGNRWQPVSLLDTDQLTFAPADEFAALSALTNLNALWGVPHWLRDETQAPDFQTIALRKAGLKQIPAPPKIPARVS